jgi:glutaredoxin-dependent peroxiredoxin
MIEVGDRWPDATVFAAPGKPVTTHDAPEGSKALFVFYLFDFSSTWTSELELLRDRSAEFEQAGVRLFGVSRDSPWTHIAWSQVLDLNFPLLSDWNADAVQALGIGFEHRGLKDVAARSTFLVGEDGTVRGAWRYETGEVPDFDVPLAAARAL